MRLEKMISSIIILAIALVFSFVLILYQNRHKNRYPALKTVIWSTFLQMISVLMFVLADKINKGVVRSLTFYLSLLTLTFAYGLSLRGLIIFLDKKLSKLFYIFSGSSVVAFAFIALLFRHSTKIFAMIVLFSVMMYVITIFVAINYNRTKDQILKWLPYTIINITPLLYFLFNFIILVLVEGNKFDVFYNYDGENLILKIIILVIATNVLGIVVTLNEFSFSFLDLESELFNQLFNSVPNIVIAIDPKTKLIKYVNDTFTNDLGFSKKEVINTYHLGELLSYDLNSVNDILEKRVTNKFYTIMTKRKSEYYASVSSTIVNFEEGELIIVSMNDISKIQSERNEYRKLAYYDELTTLPNRRVLQNNFSRKINDGDKFGLIIIDVDNFKFINDTYGHIMGDNILKLISDRLRPYDGGTDTVARYGGDEFILLISNNENIDMNNFASTLPKLFDEPFIINGIKIQIEISYGYSCYPDDAHSMTALIEIADQRLYENKSKKKN